MTPAGVIQINADQVFRTGEPHSLLLPGMLDSACARPRNRWAYEDQDDVVILGVSLMLGIAHDHPFLQGNKRTAFVAMVGFLGANGYDVEFDDSDYNADILIKAVTRQISEADFVESLRPRVWPTRKTKVT